MSNVIITPDPAAVFNVGRVTSYADAVKGGYQGTREEWERDLANLGTTAAEVEANRQAVAEDKAAVEGDVTTVGEYKDVASAAAAAALQSAESAHTDALAATEAKEAAQTAQGLADEAKADAVSAKAAAESAQTEANASASAATEAALAAGNAATTATANAGAAADSATAAAASAAAAAESARTLTIDTTLTQEGQAADAKAVGENITNLKSAFDDFKDDIYAEQVGDKYELVEPNNWYNAATMTTGKLNKDGTTEEHSGQFYTSYIPVKKDDVIRAYYISTLAQLYISRVCCYDSSKTVVASAGSNNMASSFTVPEGISYVRITLANNLTPWITKNLIPTSASDRRDYFDPYYRITDDFLTPESESKLNSIPSGGINNTSVKGSNLIPISPNGIGAYYLNGAVIKYDATYTTFHYAIVPLKQNTRYFVNSEPRWWILTDDNDNVISGAQYFNPRSKRYIDSGLATRLYYTVEKASWDRGAIIAEGISGTRDNIQQTALLKPINQLAADGWYACALPKVSIRFTVGINEKFYYKNILSLPDTNMISLSVGGFQTTEEDGVFIPITTAGAFNNYLFTVYDSNLSIVEQNVNAQVGRIFADNVSNCSALLIGDSTIERDSAKIGQTLLDAFAARNKTITLLGTRGSGDNKNEGRSGWSAADYCRAAERGGVTNAFYNSSTEGFDFSYYMTNQGYESVDFVVIQLGINDLYNIPLYTAKARIDTLITDMTTIISSIKTYNADQKIILNLPTPCTAKTTGQNAMPTVQQKTIRAKFIYYNALMEVLSTGFKNVRCSHCHLILDPETEIADLIHPTTAGLEKMGMETLSQINCWQNA